MSDILWFIILALLSLTEFNFASFEFQQIRKPKSGEQTRIRKNSLVMKKEFGTKEVDETGMDYNNNEGSDFIEKSKDENVSTS